MNGTNRSERCFDEAYDYFNPNSRTIGCYDQLFNHNLEEGAVELVPLGNDCNLLLICLSSAVLAMIIGLIRR